LSILVTGSKGFIGRNLVATLHNEGYESVYECDADTTPEQLSAFCQAATFVFHLAGVNRPPDAGDFMPGNAGFTATLLSNLNQHGNSCPILFASSAQAALDNPYGQSKKAAEDLLFAHSRETSAPVFVYRLPNVFGKWCRPNYNSVVATFLHNIARAVPITINDPSANLTLAYVDDVVDELLRALRGVISPTGQFASVPVTHSTTVGALADLIQSFHHARASLAIPALDDAFTKKLYATYLSYLPAEALAYELHMNADARGSFTEFARTMGQGQFSVNIAKPGITKGNHWHHTKHEKFLVVSGKGVIRLRAVGSDSVVAISADGERLKVVEIPPGYTHNIENIGDTDLVTLMWASEAFEPQRPDTFFLQV